MAVMSGYSQTVIMLGLISHKIPILRTSRFFTALKKHYCKQMQS